MQQDVSVYTATATVREPVYPDDPETYYVSRTWSRLYTEDPEPPANDVRRQYTRIDLIYDLLIMVLPGPHMIDLRDESRVIDHLLLHAEVATRVDIGRNVKLVTITRARLRFGVHPPLANDPTSDGKTRYSIDLIEWDSKPPPRPARLFGLSPAVHSAVPATNKRPTKGKR